MIAGYRLPSSGSSPMTAHTIHGLGLAPILTVADVETSMHFYQGLGFVLEERYEREGKLGGARLAAGEARVNLTQDDWAKGKNREKGAGIRLFIPVDQDIDALAGDLKASGVTLEADPQDMPWGRSFMLTDPDGFKITIARLR